MGHKMFSTLKKFDAFGTHFQCLVLWFFVAISMPFTGDALFEGDTCTMKSRPGVCMLASQCPQLEMAVRDGTFSARDIVNCGFATHEEIICCPAGKAVETDNRSDDRYIFEESDTSLSTIITSTTTTEAINNDFWLDLLTTTTTPIPQINRTETTTPAQPDFWLSLISTTTTMTTTTTTTTTPKPLIINGREVDPNEKFIDLTAMLSANNGRDENEGNTLNSENSPHENEKLRERQIPINNPIVNPTFDQNVPRPQQFFEPNRFQNGHRDAQQSWRGDPANMNGNTLIQRPFQLQTIPNQISINLPSPIGILNAHQPFRSGRVQTFDRQQRFNGPQQLEWHENNDFSKVNPLSESIWPSNGPQNADLRNHPNEFFTPASSPVPFLNIAAGSFIRTTRAAFAIKATRNPIELVNENLRKAGLEITKGRLQEDQSEERKSSDPFAPFQFRPQPEENLRAEGNNRNFNKKPVWGNRKSSPPTTTPTTIVTQRNTDRPAVVACREIDDGLTREITRHILGGIPAELGEFPHMAAIGMTSIGNDDGPYSYDCGGTLIARRFVLTAAHCVVSRNIQPAVVLLGLVDLNDEEERSNAEEVRIARTHIHPEYISSRTYHDIAILELEREVTYGPNIYPTCLHTDLNDPPSSSTLLVTGWGTTNTATKTKSNILLKAKLEIVPVDRCNASFVEVGLNRRNAQGIQLQQMCAIDPGFQRDACQGDSGGPLNLVLDESLKQYRVIGVISTGFGCATSTPGVYARVAAYLDFIESVVWPSRS